ncbi:MAG: 16S rRNA (cytosine(1402)-N(4))-methyltransferase RsmH [Gammaproteobacteria bacterium]|nr:16S rRNA (cytosine(1402)-N(4))-methyltransferase RsmH [Gammaproteobacteria bacterium]
MTGELDHKPVLFDEALEALNIRPSGCYLDGTFGRGGHGGAILDRLDEQGCLLACDKDPEAIRHGQAVFGDDSRFEIVYGSFAELGEIAAARGLLGKVDGILLDLGVSSPQLDAPERGFSFQKDGPLDMRMDNCAGMSAAQWLETAEESEITQVLKGYGEERFGKRIAHAIVTTREEVPLTTTAQLAALIAEAMPVHDKGKHPATRSFQGIRIFINRELDDLEQVLDQVISLLAPGGRLAIISFHSLEDRLVKRFIRDKARGDMFPPGVPVTQDQLKPQLKKMGRAIRAGSAEVDLNPRSRSAVLRIAERL